MITLMLLGLLIALCGLLATFYASSTMASCVIGPAMLTTGMFAATSMLLLITWGRQ